MPPVSSPGRVHLRAGPMQATRMGRQARAAAWGLALLAAAAGAAAQNVVLAGRMGNQALLVIDGRAHTLAVGAQAAGVRLQGWAGDEAQLLHNGQALRLRIGGAPAQLSGTPPPAARRDIVIPMSSGGHFVASGSINGKPVQFMVDTGATMVAMGQVDAQRLGVDLSQARAGTTQTANGPVPVQMVVLNQVRVGEVTVANVGAVVLPLPMPYLLLGNSFLSRFQMRRENDVMRLELR
jgi:aspartyl protease family protein